MATTWELISIALMTGIGAGIGNPIGQWFYKKYLEPRLDKTHDIVQTVKDKITNGKPIETDSDIIVERIIR